MITEENDKKRILIACHNDPTSGHLGVKKTVKRVRERFAWKGINDEVAIVEYMSKNEVCNSIFDTMLGVYL